MKRTLVTLLILITSILLIGVILAYASPIKFLPFMILIIPAICIIACLVLLISFLFLPKNASNAVHYIIRIGFPVLLVVYAAFFPEQETIQKIPLKNGYSCSIYAQVFDDFTGEGLYYQILHERSVVVPMTLYGYVTEEQQSYRFSVVYAANDTIIGILDVSAFSVRAHQLIAIYDTRINESWPRLRGDEVSHDPAVKQKWMSIFEQLHRENPDMPVPQEFLKNPNEA